jgi:pimeloyl-ACP methyl ester carboxylesterase
MPLRLTIPRAAGPLLAAALAFAAGTPCRAYDSASGKVTIETGQIAGAQFAIASPPGFWNHRAVILAHGYRPDGAPLLADLNPERPWIKALLDEGWMVATTSYRRNGVVIGDAIADIDALRKFIAEEHDEPERVILAGESMGGLIVTIIAERDKGLYDGAMAFDPTLYVKELNAKVGITLLPRIPLLFVATQREAAASRSYLTALVARPAPVIQPVLFLIAREGHTNINQAEHLAAFHALNAWIDGGTDALPKPRDQAPYFDATVAPDPGPSTAVIHADPHGLATKVAEVDPVYGNILLEAQAGDFKEAGIPPMTYCRLRVYGVDHRALYGRTYTDVKDGEWIAFPDADGRTVLSRGFSNAAGTAGLKPGDTVEFFAIQPGDAPLR